ncbi:MAG: hypothetical protein Q9171_006085 [Xanthocarpia ochracea]
MADALCGPSNPLQNLQKHTSVDRTLQQDRLQSRQSPLQGFRTPNPNAGILDAEFEAFKAGEPVYSEPYQDRSAWHNHLPSFQPSSIPQSQAIDWASDFQNLHVHDAQVSPLPSSQFRLEAPLQRNSSNLWQQDFLQQNKGSSINYQTSNLGASYTPFAMSAGNPNLYDGRYHGPIVGQQPEIQASDSFDEEAFEKAFDAAKLEYQEVEATLQPAHPVHETRLAETSQGLEDSTDYRIGSDRILDEASQRKEERETEQDADELARTAGQLLDNVKYDQSTKFRESNFLSLMRQLRDKEVKVEGDSIVDPIQATAITLTETRDSSDGSSVSEKHSFHASIFACDDEASYTPETAGHPSSNPAAVSPSYAPPPFSSLNFSQEGSANQVELSIADPDFYPPPPFAPTSPAEPQQPAASDLELATKAELGTNKEGESSTKTAEEKEPPPPYTEGSSPLGSFTYVMAAAGGPASIITQVPQGGPPPPGGHTFADVGPDENISLDLRGTKFILSRDELLTLPEFVLLSLFPNGLLPDGHMNSFHEGDTYPVDYDPASLQYMLDFFRTVAQTIPSSSPSPTTDTPSTDTTMQGSARDMLQDRAGIIVLREDLDFYAIPPKAEIDQSEMIEVKRAAGRALLKQDGIFSGLRKSEEAGTTEQHLIEMLTAGGFYNDDRWGHRASEPNKAVICSLALARLRTDIKGNDLANSNAVGMAQKLLLFWRKPARRCWWEGVELENVDGIEGKLKVWIRRVWTLEMSVIGLR